MQHNKFYDLKFTNNFFPLAQDYLEQIETLKLYKSIGNIDLRGHQTRKLIKQESDAATTIQANFRHLNSSFHFKILLDFNKKYFQSY